MNEEAQNLLKRAKALDAVGRGDTSIPLLEHALALTPNDGNLLCQLAVAHFHAKQWDKMRDCAEKAISASPNSEYPHRLHSVSLLNLHKWNESLTAAREAVRQEPSEPEALFWLGTALLRQRTAEAKEVALNLAQLAPEKPSTHLLLARVYQQQQQWVEMERCARRALSLDAESCTAHLLLAQSLNCQKRKQEALACYLDLLRLDPTHAVAGRCVKDAFVHPFLSAMTSLTPMLWLCFDALFLAINIHGFLAGLAALGAAIWFLSALNAITCRFFPGLFLMRQKGFRQQPSNVQEFVIQGCRRDWLRNTLMLNAMSIVVFPLLAMVAAPNYFRQRRERLAPRSVPQAKTG